MSSKADSARRCAFCRTQVMVPAFRPFCSQGCRNRDLNAWLSDAYVIPGNAHEDELSDVSALDNDNAAG